MLQRFDSQKVDARPACAWKALRDCLKVGLQSQTQMHVEGRSSQSEHSFACCQVLLLLPATCALLCAARCLH